MLLETLKIFDGKIFYLPLHSKRLNQSRKKLLGFKNNIDLKDYIKIPFCYQKGLVKCSVFYSKKIEQINFCFYKKKKIKALKIIYCNEIDYSYKYADRSSFEKLTKTLNQQEEILIIKKEFITDTSFSNVILLEKTSKKWFTPSFPLLKGIQREVLIKKKEIYKKEIRLSDLENYSQIGLINAMLDLKEAIKLPIDKIKI